VLKAQIYGLNTNFSRIYSRQAFSLFLRKLIGMNSLISEGVQVSVETFYQPDYSNPIQSEFMFAYRITLENHNNFAVKLHRRNWQIFDSNGSNREVEGEGVVGVQPTIQPGETYQYVSGCNLRTEMGKMKGTYQMENLNNKQMFQVDIPPFEMIVPMKNN
jgi:ApaG protein